MRNSRDGLGRWRGDLPTHPKGIQGERKWELLPLFKQKGRGWAEAALAGCVALHRVLFKSRIHQWKRHFHPKLEKKTLKEGPPGQSSGIAFASEESFIKNWWKKNAVNSILYIQLLPWRGLRETESKEHPQGVKYFWFWICNAHF